MRRHQEVLTSLLAVPVDRQGHTDLTIHGLKFSGNAQRRRNRCLLFHGSFLLHFDLALIEKTLPMPSHQPDYRANRSHQDFLMNLELPDHVLKSALIEAWGATYPLPHLPLAETKALALEKYSQAEWNLKF
jgi:lipoate-protein ligase A